MLSDVQRQFVNNQRVGRLASADSEARPHVVPVCFVLSRDCVYVTIDRKPKRVPGQPLKRERNLKENPSAAIVFDHYDDDWTQLGWVMLRGTVEILSQCDESLSAQAALKRRYPQYQTMDLSGLPVIALRIERVASWGRLPGENAKGLERA